ncbi:phage regulator Rha-like protein [Rhizobium skierniewicense]|uniref:Phage regulator Rha-like protein n=1 Tax=Rhizobium skierniewicense TaxID=984260 RepID=A0A7W6FZR9_9HYPH|nr:Rha family transcriptional regulator [Rhizobium skierniewicense]MBB3944103.1 phage regulator Rha-like protein [Rhizobium skierniewicense]
MSSREIAKLTGKRHTNVIRDIRTMLTGLKSEPRDFVGSYTDSTCRQLPCFNLPKRETLILVSGYSVELRARIIDRWMELEEQQAKTQVATITATEVSTMMAKYMAEMQETSSHKSCE